MSAVQTILDIYERDMTDLLYNEAIDLLSLLNDEQFEVFWNQNPEFGNIISEDNYRNTTKLKKIIDMLVNHIMQI